MYIFFIEWVVLCYWNTHRGVPCILSDISKLFGTLQKSSILSLNASEKIRQSLENLQKSETWKKKFSANTRGYGVAMEEL